MEVDLDEFAHEKILGMRWDPKHDMFDFKVKINFSPKCKNVQKGENITKSQIESSVPTSLTPRMVLSQVASVYLTGMFNRFLIQKYVIEYTMD